MDIYRTPPLMEEAKEGKKPLKHPRPISMVGGGRGSSLIAFAQGGSNS